MRSLLCFSFLLTMSSCGVYNSGFDCPPGRGIGCAPVNEVLDLIVEKKEGEDVFVNNPGTAILLRQQEKEKMVQTPSKKKKKYLIQDDKGNWKLVPLSEEEKQ